MIFITGDTHAPLDMGKLSLERFPIQEELTKVDYMLVCGDFGGVWDGGSHDKVCIDDFNKRTFTTLFVDGNHENFDLLDAYPVEVWNGGKVHRISDSVIHLMRGQVFNLEGQTFFTMGGGNSIDKQFRLPGRSWWPQEMPSQAEYDEALVNLGKHKYMVDYIITHAAPENLMCLFHPKHDDERELNLFLQDVVDKTQYRKYLFAHLHEDRILDEKHRVLYHDVILLNQTYFDDERTV